MLRYSFIIPHKNSPKLLLRCIGSIPKRDDIQIIVVDDNSSSDKKPKGLDPKIEVVLLDCNESKGAGRARNIGISLAKGEWLLFPDADDFYTDGFINTLDKYCHRDDLQILFFSCKGVNTDTLEPNSCADRLINRIEHYDGTEKSMDIVRYQTNVPWCKMIKREFVVSHGLFYDEVLKGNDVLFSYMSSYFAKDIEVVKDRLYVYTFNPKSITHAQRSIEGSLTIRQNQIKSKLFLEHIGLPHLHKRLPFYNTALSVLKHQGIMCFMKFICCYTLNYKNFLVEAGDYISTLKVLKTQLEITRIRK